MARPRSLGSAHVTFFPPTQTSPPLKSSRPAIAFSSVDLPQPDGPRRTRNSPSSIVRFRSSNATTLPKATERRRVSILALISALDRTGGDAPREPLAGNEIDDQRDERCLQRRRHVDVVFVCAH